MSDTNTQAQPTVSPWDQPEAPTEEAIRARYDREGLSPYTWSNGPGYRYAAHRHSYHKVLYVVEGSICFNLHPSGPLDLHPGDRLDLPAGIEHSAEVGDEGVRCLEARQEPG